MAPGDLRNVPANLEIEDSLATLKDIQIEGHALKQGETEVFCQLLIMRQRNGTKE